MVSYDLRSDGWKFRVLSELKDLESKEYRHSTSITVMYGVSQCYY